MAKQMVRAKVFRVGRAPSIEQIDASIEGLQAIVGGYIEDINLDPQHENHHILYCNEDGRRLKLSPNLQLPNGVTVLGDAVMVLHDSDGEAIPLITEREPEAIRGASRHLAEETTMEEEKQSGGTFQGIPITEAAKKDKLLMSAMEAHKLLGEAQAAIEEICDDNDTLKADRDALLIAASRVARETPCYCDRDRTKPDFKPCGCCDLAKIITQVRTEKEPYEKPAIRAGTPKETEEKGA